MAQRGKSVPKPEIVRKLTPNEPEKERQRRLRVAEDTRARIEAQSVRVHELILAQPPVELLGYRWAQLHMSVLTEHGKGMKTNTGRTRTSSKNSSLRLSTSMRSGALARAC
jgi:hypothetical protein